MAWHPIETAEPCEWVLRNGTFAEPFGVIRELRFGHGQDMQVWFRLCTWSPTSEGRRLLGYHQDPRVLAVFAWERSISEAQRLRAEYGRTAHGGG